MLESTVQNRIRESFAHIGPVWRTSGDKMSNIIPLFRPLQERKIIEALREITDLTTEVVVIVTVSPKSIGVRSFGPNDKCIEGLTAALEALK